MFGNEETSVWKRKDGCGCDGGGGGTIVQYPPGPLSTLPCGNWTRGTIDPEAHSAGVEWFFASDWSLVSSASIPKMVAGNLLAYSYAKVLDNR